MCPKDEFGQTDASRERNASYFLNQNAKYAKNVRDIDTYHRLSDAINRHLVGVKHLLDVGNGGVFDYDTSAITSIVGVDLFLDKLPKNLSLPCNVTMVQGSALDLPDNHLAGVEIDAVIMVMLLHHLVGKNPVECLGNVRRAMQEAYRVVRPGGRMIVVESCVPTWFYQFEKIVYGISAKLLERLITHPATLQYPRPVLASVMEEAGFHSVSVTRIPKGKYVLQYGVRVPSFLTPVMPTILVGEK